MAERQKLKCNVYLDGRLIGTVNDGAAFAREVRKNRRLGVVSGEINVTLVKKLAEVHINADKGRARKAYIV
ncbi:MAG: DNA-directed RNA polymerase subunit B, partial [Candidatus Micrarchaeaceae archaeon]